MSSTTKASIRKIPFILLIFLLIVATVFDLISLLPLLGFVMTFLFMTMVKLSLFMAGYHAGIMRMIFMFLVLLLFETILSPIPTNILYVISFYIFNQLLYKAQQKALLQQSVTQSY